MKTPIFVREMTADEIAAIKTGLRSSDRFVVRRSQIVWSSSQQETARKIAKRLGCDDETVRKVIKQFNAQGLKALRAGSRRPHKTVAKISDECAEELKEILYQSPRKFGQETSLWTLALLAKVSYEKGLVKSLVSIETMRATLERFGMKWARAKQWITSPDPDYLRKKTTRPADGTAQPTS